jgi:hypothetical protein
MASIRIAFLILAHRNADQIERLRLRLRPHNVFVHVDAQAADFPTNQLAELPGVTVVSPRRAVHWGDFSMVEATLTLLSAARAVGSFDRYVLLSGECYPAKPIAALEEAFETNPRREWISLTPIAAGSHLETMTGRRWRMAPLVGARALDAKLRGAWNNVSKMVGRDLRREIGTTPYFGSQWFALSARVPYRVCARRALLPDDRWQLGVRRICHSRGGPGGRHQSVRAAAPDCSVRRQILRQQRERLRLGRPHRQILPTQGFSTAQWSAARPHRSGTTQRVERLLITADPGRSCDCDWKFFYKRPERAGVSTLSAGARELSSI